eukprot:m51a1_g889 hypothetical protein (241) ;mRNA; r:7850-9489
MECDTSSDTVALTKLLWRYFTVLFKGGLSWQNFSVSLHKGSVAFERLEFSDGALHWLMLLPRDVHVERACIEDIEVKVPVAHLRLHPIRVSIGTVSFDARDNTEGHSSGDGVPKALRLSEEAKKAKRRWIDTAEIEVRKVLATVITPSRERIKVTVTNSRVVNADENFKALSILEEHGPAESGVDYLYKLATMQSVKVEVSGTEGREHRILSAGPITSNLAVGISSVILMELKRWRPLMF